MYGLKIRLIGGLVMLKPTMIAPDFQAEACFLGERITVSLGDYLNQYVVLFFYSSDFTFV